MPEEKPRNYLIQSFFAVFKEPLFVFLAASVAANILAVYYFLFSQTTTLPVFFSSNTVFYSWASLIMTVLTAILIGISASILAWLWKERRFPDPCHVGNSFISSFLGALAAGCPVCGAFLISALGISGSLAAFPFQGLEIKAMSLGLISFAVISSLGAVAKKSCVNVESVDKEPLIRIREGKFIFNVNKETFGPFGPILLGFALLFVTAYLPLIGSKLNIRYTFQTESQANVSLTAGAKNDSSQILDEINPVNGYKINAKYGNLGPQLLAVGVIDFERMKELYEKSGAPLTKDQIKILTQGSDEKITITPENSYFLLNFFWALGLANKNVILDEGPISKYGKNQIGNFASTGGWTLGTKESTEFFSKSELIKLTADQQNILEDFAFNSYRPCCSNPTGFPDCNHGMAALALGELMASQGANVDDIFEAFKYVNSFWFPQTYFDVAKYFKAKEGKDWSEVSGRIIAGKDYSTPQGWQRVRSWLSANGLIEEAPSGGGSCGV